MAEQLDTERGATLDHRRNGKFESGGGFTRPRVARDADTQSYEVLHVPQVCGRDATPRPHVFDRGPPLRIGLRGSLHTRTIKT